MLSHLNFWSYSAKESPSDSQTSIDLNSSNNEKEKVDDSCKDTLINTEKAKEWGSYIMEVGISATSKAAKQMSSTAKQLRENVSKIAIVEKSNIISKFSDEQLKFKEEKRLLERKSEEMCLPWMEALSETEGEQQLLKSKILSISTDERNFLRNPPAGCDFEFNYELHSPVAQLLLKEDADLANMRYILVPKRIREETFWRNYFYRVFLIKQSLQSDTENVISKEDEADREDREERARVVAVAMVTAHKGDGGGSGGGDGDSDDWEAELQKELLEFELVNEENGGGCPQDGVGGAARDAVAYGEDDDSIEKEILDELEK